MPVQGQAARCLAACPELRLPASTVAYLDCVLSELTNEEVQDYATVRVLLEPFLLDALKQSGRESPHCNKSNAKVELLCQQLFDELRHSSEAPQRRLGDPKRICDALQKAAASVSDKLHLPADLVDGLAASLAELTWADLSSSGETSDDRLAAMLEPSLQEAFHECGEWPASEDAERAKMICAALLAELHGNGRN